MKTLSLFTLQVIMSSILKSCLLTAVLAISLAGCASFHRDPLKSETENINDAKLEAVISDKDLPEMEIATDFNPDLVFVLSPLRKSAALPKTMVKSTSFNEAGVYDALLMLGTQAGLAIVVEGGPKASERFGKISSTNIQGTFSDVVEELSENMGFFYTLRKNTLHIKQDDQFVVTLPPSLNDDNAAGLTNTMQYLGARDTYLDRLNNTMVFTTNRKSLEKIEGYLNQMREQRALIVYDVNIFQVDLKDTSSKGIKWNTLAWAAGGITSASTGAAASGTASSMRNAITATSSALGAGVVLATSKFSVDSLIQFLETQGSVKTISRPRISLISGNKGNLRVGQTTTIISKIGSNVTSNLNQITTETKDIRTGFEMALHGRFQDNTVETRIVLTNSEIIRINVQVALGTELRFPDLADIALDTTVRARPGDMLLLGGIKVDTKNEDTSRAITGSSVGNSVHQSELVISLRAKVVHFKSKDKKL